jgi:hypothetical protein
LHGQESRRIFGNRDLKKGRCLAPAFAAGLVLPVWSYKT